MSIDQLTAGSLTGYLLAESTIPADVVTEITARQIVHNQIEVLSVLERIVHVDDEQILKLGEDLPLVNDRLDTALGDDPRLGHLLHSVVLLGFLTLDSPYLAETSFTDAEMVDEVCL